MNNQSFIGNLLADPELKTGPSGKPYARFRIMVNEGERGTDSEKSHPLNFTAFGSLGENLAASLRKGMRVVVTARVDTYKREVTLVENGEQKTINMDQISFVATGVGPDLRFATVGGVTKTAPPAGYQAPQGGGQQAPQGGGQPAPQGGGQQGGYQPAPQGGADDF